MASEMTKPDVAGKKVLSLIEKKPSDYLLACSQDAQHNPFEAMEPTLKLGDTQPNIPEVASPRPSRNGKGKGTGPASAPKPAVPPADPPQHKGIKREATRGSFDTPKRRTSASVSGGAKHMKYEAGSPQDL